MICKLKHLSIVFVGCVAIPLVCDMQAGVSLSNSREPGIVERNQQSQAVSSINQEDERIAKLITSESGGMLTVRTSLSKRWVLIAPAYLWGDFNGDGAIDLIIVASLNVKADFNPQPFTTFMISKVPPPTYRDEYRLTPQDLKRYRDSDATLLVVFHGASGMNIQDFKIKEQFIVLDGIDNHSEKMLLFRGRLKYAAAGDGPRIAPPRLVGDAIVILDDQNVGTAIFWHEGRYCWYPVENFKESRRGQR